jgi:hypothetical protein
MKAVVYAGLVIIFATIPSLLCAQTDETVGEEPAVVPAEEPAPAPGGNVTPEPQPTEKSVARHLIMYIPNRVFDVFDIVRAKVGIGPGLTVAVRVTDIGDVWAGGHTSAWIGLPGARQKPKLPLPVGVESRAGIELSVVELATQASDVKPYPPDEVGADVHLLLAGGGAGVSVWEALDAVLGVLFIDISGDDL